MSDSTAVIPVVLFAYSRCDHLRRTLACLKREKVPLLYVFADGAKGDRDHAAVEATRAELMAVDWTEVRLVQRDANLGLGRNVLTGVSEVAAKHNAFIVWEDDLICVPDTYAWLCAALRRYAEDARVMSVTAWTHPRITPQGLRGQAYLDPRGDCWAWGAWSRSWSGMRDQSALEKMRLLTERGEDAETVGGDLVSMARLEASRNIWAVRWLYHHLLNRGLCLRPPHSMVEHIGFDATASNAANSDAWANPPLTPAPPIPEQWPEPREHPLCRRLWRAAAPGWPTRFQRIRLRARKVIRNAAPGFLLRARRSQRSIRWDGNYSTWDAALHDSQGYDAPHILQRVKESALQVKSGVALFERDGVAFHDTPPVWRPLDTLLEIAMQDGGRLDVLDVGGGLGSAYLNHRHAWDTIPRVTWRVLEQPAFVVAGKSEFHDGRLTFFEKASEATRGGPQVLLLASVLPYLQDPYGMLRDLLTVPYRLIIMERTGILPGSRDVITVQHVPSVLGGGSYPCRFFSRENLLAAFAGYRVTHEEKNEEGETAGREFRTLWLEPSLVS